MNKLWDDLKDNMKEWGVSAVEKAEEISRVAVAKGEEFTKISKLKFDILQLQKEKNKVYEKLGNPNTVIDYEGEWKLLPGLDNVIFVMFKHDESVDKYRYIVIDGDGKLKITKDDKSTSELIDYGVETTPIIKLFGDAQGYMNIIDGQFLIIFIIDG